MQDETLSKFLRYTLTVDASFNYLERKIGIGILIQATDKPGRRGTIVDELAETHSPTLVSQKEMELFAIFRAIDLAANRNYRRINVRSDCNQLRRLVKEDLKRGQVIGNNSLHVQIFQLTRSFDEVKISYCPRRKNGGAHGLARKGALIEPRVRNDDS